MIRRGSHIALEVGCVLYVGVGAWVAAGRGQASARRSSLPSAAASVAAAAALAHRAARPPQVDDFDEAEAMLRRHGVEYSRHVLPGA